MALPQITPAYTYDDYCQWEGKWELWDGVPVAMAPSARFSHGSFQAVLAALLLERLADTGCSDGQAVLEIDWKVSDTYIVRPDLSVYCGEPPAVHMEHPPALIIEILSPGHRNQEHDRVHKALLYRNTGVRHYLIADPDARTLEDGYNEHDTGDHAIRLNDGCRFSLPQDLS